MEAQNATGTRSGEEITFFCGDQNGPYQCGASSQSWSPSARLGENKHRPLLPRSHHTVSPTSSVQYTVFKFISSFLLCPTEILPLFSELAQEVPPLARWCWTQKRWDARFPFCLSRLSMLGLKSGHAGPPLPAGPGHAINWQGAKSRKIQILAPSWSILPPSLKRDFPGPQHCHVR